MAPKRTLPPNDVIATDYLSGLTQPAIAKKYNVSQSRISEILKQAGIKARYNNPDATTCRNGHSRDQTLIRQDGRKICRACRRIRHKKWRDIPENKPKQAEWARVHRRTVGNPRKKLIIDSAKDRPCMDCGIKYPSYVMDFDHQRDKKFIIGRARWSTISTQRILDEIDKCDVVCANCHRERTLGPKALVT